MQNSGSVLALDSRGNPVIEHALAACAMSIPIWEVLLQAFVVARSKRVGRLIISILSEFPLDSSEGSEEENNAKRMTIAKNWLEPSEN